MCGLHGYSTVDREHDSDNVSGDNVSGLIRSKEADSGGDLALVREASG